MDAKYLLKISTLEAPKYKSFEKSFERISVPCLFPETSGKRPSVFAKSHQLFSVKDLSVKKYVVLHKFRHRKPNLCSGSIYR